MPVFYFHLGFNGRVLTDDEGTELADRAAARTEAQAIIRELASTGTGRALGRSSDCYLRVADADGPFLHLPLAGPALEVVPAHRPPDPSRPRDARSPDRAGMMTALAAQIDEQHDRTAKLMQQNRRLREALASELRATERIRNQTLHLLACARALDFSAGAVAATHR